MLLFTAPHCLYEDNYEVPRAFIAPIEETVVTKPEPRYREAVMEISYYTANDEGMNGHGITASGTRVKEGRTVAMSSRYALGTKICIDGHWYVNEDRGGYIVGDRVDVYVADKDEALRLGRQRKTVKIEEE